MKECTMKDVYIILNFATENFYKMLLILKQELNIYLEHFAFV